MYKFAINRPISTLMLMLALIMFGLLSYKTMPVNLFPNVEFPVVTIKTQYYGADPETVETKVTDKIEEIVSSIDGIDKLMSTSYEGLSVVTVQFKLSKNLEEAVNDVRDKVNGLKLDSEIETPLVSKVDATGGAIIKLYLASKDTNADSKNTMILADNTIKPFLQKIEGVGNVKILGYRDREIKVFLDPYKLSKYNLTITELENIIKSSNIKMGTGKLISETNEIIIKTKGEATTISELENLVILNGIKLKEVAEIKDYLSDIKSFSSYNGNEGLVFEIQKISGKNSYEIIKNIKEQLPKLEEKIGDKYEIQLLQDTSIKIKQNIDSVTFDLIYGSILAILIVFLFLRSFSATFISALAIPTSIIGTFALIDWLGYDLNRLTLIGLTLAIGIFIDDAIVVIENISKKMEAGYNSFQASFEGIKEISFSVLAISSMLLSVFIPVAFMDGIVGQFFNSFAMTVAVGVIISYIVVVMLIPSASARFLNEKHNFFFKITEPFFVFLEKSYKFILTILVKFKYITILFVMVGVYYSFSLAPKIGFEFVPMEDNGEIQITVKGKIGTSLLNMKDLMIPLENEIKKIEDIDYTVLSVGYTDANETHKGMIYAKLKELGVNRTKSQELIVKEISDKLKPYKNDNFNIVVEEVPVMSNGQSQAPIQLIITGGDFEELSNITKKFTELFNNTEGIINIDNDYENGKPELNIFIKQENARRAGVSTLDLSNILLSSFSSDQSVSKFDENGKQYNITVRLNDNNRKDIETLKRIQVKNSKGELVSLEGLIEMKDTVGTSSINRYNRERKILLTTGIYNITLDKVVNLVEENKTNILPKGYNVIFGGDVEHMEETNKAFAMAVIFAVIMIYLILASLYESFLQPFIIMIAMPLSFTGVFISLYLSHLSFSIFVMIGIILLLGMVGKNAVLVIDFANKNIEKGMSVEEAVIDAGEKRLRPILMTTFAMVGAMIPLAFGGGVGHESNAPMAMAIIGGLISSTILALLVVPSIYRIIYPVDNWLRKFYNKKIDE